MPNLSPSHKVISPYYKHLIDNLTLNELAIKLKRHKIEKGKILKPCLDEKLAKST